jgi:hypothetical protein
MPSKFYVIPLQLINVSRRQKIVLYFSFASEALIRKVSGKKRNNGENCIVFSREKFTSETII